MKIFSVIQSIFCGFLQSRRNHIRGNVDTGNGLDGLGYLLRQQAGGAADVEDMEGRMEIWNDVFQRFDIGWFGGVEIL